ncbi:MAG: hypothetical protein ABWY04_19750 [Arthrobacter sp.]
MILITFDTERAFYLPADRVFSAAERVFSDRSATALRALAVDAAPEPAKKPGVACETSQVLLIIIRPAA